MLLGSSKWVSTAFSATWKVKATPAGRSLFQLALSARRTSESGSSSWPTPTATDAKGANTRSEGKERPVCDDDLPTRVLRLFPTPCADDARGTVAETHRGVGTRKRLIYYARRPVPATWPTPLATDGEKGGPNQHGGRGDLRLPSAVHQYRDLPEDRFWRTPNTFDSLTPKSQEALAHELEHRPGRAEPNNLRDQVAVVEGLRRWPTPTAKDADSAANALWETPPCDCPGPAGSLAREVWPTPLSRDGKGGCQLGRLRNGRVCWDNLDQAIQAARPGGLLDPASPSTPGSRPEQLSAAWVEALQNFPAGHTALEPSEMPSSRRRSTPSSRRSRTAKPTD